MSIKPDITDSENVRSTAGQNKQALNESVIRQHLKSSVDLIDAVEIFQSLPSTNTYLLDQPIALGKAKICLAESQLSGRGRRGNDWQSAADKNIMLSLSWGFESWPETVTGLGLAAGLVVAERLNQDHKVGVGIKWPNDLLINNDKLAGVLVELSTNSSGRCNVVIGLGLNVHQPDWSKTAEKKAVDKRHYRWTDLISHQILVDRNILVAAFIDEWVQMLKLFEQHGFGYYLERWHALSCYANLKVVLSAEEGPDVSGRVLGVNELGALLIESDDGERHVINNSNLSLRLAN